MSRPLNMSEIDWLRAENKRLSEMKPSTADEDRQLGPKAGEDQKRWASLEQQMNKQIDDLSEQVAKLIEENNQLRHAAGQLEDR